MHSIRSRTLGSRTEVLPLTCKQRLRRRKFAHTNWQHPPDYSDLGRDTARLLTGYRRRVQRPRLTAQLTMPVLQAEQAHARWIYETATWHFSFGCLSRIRVAAVCQQ